MMMTTDERPDLGDVFLIDAAFEGAQAGFDGRAEAGGEVRGHRAGHALLDNLKATQLLFGELLRVAEVVQLDALARVAYERARASLRRNRRRSRRHLH